MKSSPSQTPQKHPANRRHREKPHQIGEKITIPAASSYPSELDAVDSPNLPISSPSDSSDRINASDSSSIAPSITDAIQESAGSGGCKEESLEVQVALDLLLRARRQVLDSPGVDGRSKKLLNYLIRTAIEPLDEMPEVKDIVDEFLGAKVRIGLLCLLTWIILVLAVMVGNGHSGTDFHGIPPPT